ncbi:MAG: plastocyanin/azurin family copper-binding protein [Nitrosopumilaceae archaeon]
MKHVNDKLGVIIAIVITAGALAFVGSTADMNDRNMQAQGERVLELTTEELRAVPSQVKETISDNIEELQDIKSEIPETLDEAIDEVEEVIPDPAPIIKKSEGKLLEIVAISPGSALPGCERANSCFIPTVVTMKPGGEVIWENHDDAVHTVTSGTPTEGPNVLFDSGIITPDGTYSVKLDLRAEYEYFCVVHPWMTGKIIVQ